MVTSTTTTTGLFTRDPIGFEGSEWNLCEYCEARPLFDVDPSGKSCESDYQSLVDDCNDGNIRCNRGCVSRDPPWFVRPKGSWAHIASCEAGCQASYMACHASADAFYAGCVANRNRLLICGSCIVVAGGLVCCLDSPVPGPADCVGGPIIACGLAMCTQVDVEE